MMLIRKSIPIASVIVVGLSMLLVSCLATVPASRELETLFGVLLLVIPVGVATWWLFRTHVASTTRQMAQIIAVTFAVCATVAYLIAVPIATLLGGYSALLSPTLGLVGAVIAVWAIMSLVCFVGCCLALRQLGSS